MNRNPLRSYLSRRAGFWLGALLLVALASVQALPTQAQEELNFPLSVSGLDVGDLNIARPTSLEFGPDDRIYVSERTGNIRAFAVVRNGDDDYDATSFEKIDIIKTQTVNYDDDGSVSTDEDAIENRQITGILTAGTATNPVLYVSSSDPREAFFGVDAGIDTNSGILHRLTCTGGIANGVCQGWERVDLVRGLARSEENHSVNGMDLDPVSNTLLLAVGGHTNKGAPSENFAGTPEYYLSAAILSIDLNQLESMPVYFDARTQTNYVYDLPTLNDPLRADIDNTNPAFPYPQGHPLYDATIDIGDPFGGNNGLNQAIIEAGSPVQIYSPGWRNAYDIVLTESGRVYSSDNGANAGWGGTPFIYNSNGVSLGDESDVTFDASAGHYCTNEFNEDNASNVEDPLQLIDGPGYYAGHPSPIRAFPDKARVIIYEPPDFNVGEVNGELLDYDLSELLGNVSGYFDPELTIADFPGNPIECGYLTDLDNEPSVNILARNSVTTGVAEYRASNFEGALQGSILTTTYNVNGGEVVYYKLNEAGDDVVAAGQLLSGFGNGSIDVTTQGDGDIFPGTIWIASYSKFADFKINVAEPTDFGAIECTGADDDAIDEDNDGYTNADEIANNTNPCSQGSKPTDRDGTQDFGQFLRSDLLDTDDDNDGLLDENDPFAIDATNGLGTSLPVFYSLEIDGGPDIDTLFSLAFTGLMTNGTETYLDQYDLGELNPGGATGGMGVEVVTQGDALGNLNDQDNSFQFGVNVDTNTQPFIIQTQVKSPFFFVGGNQSTPTDNQSFGLQFGPGNQSNYMKIVMNANGGAGGIQVLLEENDTLVQQAQYGAAEIGGDVLLAQNVELYFEIDPANLTAQPMVSLNNGTTVTDLGTPLPVPASWLDPNDNLGLATGLISTSRGAPNVTMTWGDINVYAVPSDTQALVDVDTGDINGSTFGDGSFDITNNSSTANITQITFDLNGAIIPEVVFDPNGTAGDAVAKGFSTAGNTAFVTGAVTPAIYTDPYEGGFYGMTVNFDDFNPTETITFGIDIDPVSIKGGSQPGPNESGSVSGLELAGSTVAITFDTGETHTVELYRKGDSLGASEAIARSVVPQAPTIAMTGQTTQSTVFAPEQTIEITSPTTQPIKLLQLEAGLFVEDLDGPNAGVGYDIDPWEVNSVVAVNEYDLNGSGNVSVTLTNSDAEAGYNIFAAVAEDMDGVTSPLSNIIIVKYEPDTTPTVVYRVNAEVETITATDGGPDWVGIGGTGPQSITGVSVNTGSLSTGNVTQRDASVPDYVPQGVFTKERFDNPSGVPMQWEFDVDPGTYAVRLYMAESFNQASQPGDRVFDVSVEGSVPQAFDNIDLVASYGFEVGGMKEAVVTVTDGTLDIEFIHGVSQNPLVNAIEVLAFTQDNAPIQIAEIADQTNEEGEVPFINVVAFGGTGDLTYSAQGLPPGILLGASDGDLFGTADVGAAAGGPNSDGVYNVTITVDDSDADTNDAAQESFIWTIVEEDTTPEPQVVYRVNSGGVGITASDGGPDWGFDQAATEANATGDADQGPTSQYLDLSYQNAVNKTFGLPFNGTNDTGAPNQVFTTERFSDAPNPDSMQWDFPAAAGQYRVNLYFSELFHTSVGQRSFDVEVEGQRLNGIDPYAEAQNNAFVKTFVVDMTDGNIDVNFFKGAANNPSVAAIEVISLNPSSDNNPPQVTLATGMLEFVELFEGQTERVNFTVSDADNDPLIVSAQITQNTIPVSNVDLNLVDNGDGTGYVDVTASLGDGAQEGGNYTLLVYASDTAVTSQDSTFVVITQAPEDKTNLAYADTDFGSVQIASAPVTETMTLTNNRADDIDVTSIEITGTNASNFAVVTNSILPAVPSTLTAGSGQLSFDVTFTPGMAGNYEAEAVVLYTVNGAGKKASASMTAQVTNPGENPDRQSLYRVNVGGPQLAAVDGSQPNWTLDNGVNPSPFRVAGDGGAEIFTSNNSAAYNTPLDTSDPSLNGDTAVPNGVFNFSRFDFPAAPDMIWQFPVTTENPVEVRLYFAELFNSFDAEGDRVFDVSVEGAVPASFDDIDPFATAGARGGFVLTAETTVTDGVLDIQFLHGAADNPTLNGIEIVELLNQVDPEAPQLANIDDVTYGVLAEFEQDSFSQNRFVVSATDPQGDGITYTAQGLPTGLTLNATTGAIEGIIAFDALTGGPNSNGVYPVTITATDDSQEMASDIEIFTLTVVDRTITVTVPAAGSTIAQTDALQVNWASEGGDSISGYFDNLQLYFYPAGTPDTTNKLDGLALSGQRIISDANSPVAWDAYFGQDGLLLPGDYIIELRHAKPSDVEYLSQGQPFAQTVAFSVADPNTNVSPLVTNPGDQTNVEGDAVSLPILASPPEGDQTLTYTASNLPPSLTIDPSTGVISGTLDTELAAAPGGAFIEQDGLVVIDTESADRPLPGDWQDINSYSPTFSDKIDDINEAYGDNFIVWEGNQYFAGNNDNNPDIMDSLAAGGLITYQVQINDPGTYQFRFRSQVGKDTAPTEHNDVWLRIDADNFFGSKETSEGTSIVCPGGAGSVGNACQGERAEGNTAMGWLKAYAGGANSWSWSTKTSDNDGHDIFATFNNAGIYNIEITARSNSFVLDRFVLIKDDYDGPNALSSQRAESPQTGGGDPGSDGSAGTYNVTVTATDNGDPVEASSVNFIWNVLPQGTDPVLLTVEDVTAAEDGTFLFTATLADNVADGFTVNYVVDNGETANADFVGGASPTGMLTFAGTANETQTFTIPVLDDTLAEDDETFTVRFTNTSNPVVNLQDTATGTIEDNDDVAITVADITAAEDGTFEFTATLDNPVQGGFTVDYAVANVETEAADFVGGTLPTGMLTFAGTANETQTFTIPVLDDALAEIDETFTVSFSNSSDAQVNITDTATGTIEDNDSTAIITVEDVTATEGDTFEFTATLDAAVGASFTVDYAVVNNETDAADFVGGTLPTGMLTFAGTANEAQVFTIPVLDDALIEGTETFTVEFSNVSNVAVNIDDTALGTIQDNDLPPSIAAITVEDVTETEGDPLTFTVTLDNAVQDGFTVDYTFTDGNATAGADYTATTGQLTFAGTANETQIITVPTTDDSEVEMTETFTVAFSTVSNLEVDITDTAIGFIADNDETILTIEDEQALEGDEITFTVTLNADVGMPFTVDYGVENITTENSDFVGGVLPTGTLSFTGQLNETQTITFATAEDELPSGNERFRVTLSGMSMTGAAVYSTDIGTGTIINDDTGFVLDVTNDGIVAPTDVNFVNNRLGDDVTVGDGPMADINDDGVIDIIDLNLVLEALGTTSD